MRYTNGDSFRVPMSDGTLGLWEVIDTMTNTYVLMSEYGSIIHLDFKMFETAVDSGDIKEVN